MADISTAKGRVCTGFSKPYVALYSATGTTVTYSEAQELARGVSVSLDVETSDSNDFYANNVKAESESGKFVNGSVTLGVDGLLSAAEKLIMGLPEADTDGFTAYGDDQSIPYVGVGYITRYVSGGNTSYVPTVLAKCKFAQTTHEANTQEEEVDYQTQELSATVERCDDAKHNWKFEGTEYATEAEAETALKKKLGVTA